MHVNYYDYMSESSTVFWRTVYFYLYPVHEKSKKKTNTYPFQN